MNTIKNKTAFTLIEIMAVVTIVGMLTLFGIPAYYKTLETSYMNTAKDQLRLIHAAQKLFYAKHEYYYPGTTEPSKNTTQINNDLKLNIGLRGGGDSIFMFFCETCTTDHDFYCKAVRIKEEHGQNRLP